MFIDREDFRPPAPCEGAEVKLSGTIQFFVPPLRTARESLVARASYKPVTLTSLSGKVRWFLLHPRRGPCL
jgi:hypothetical protein